jgi:hypothetical protein
MHTRGLTDNVIYGISNVITDQERTELLMQGIHHLLTVPGRRLKPARHRSRLDQ